eukprot:744813-Amphidinium_carterae.1
MHVDSRSSQGEGCANRAAVSSYARSYASSFVVDEVSDREMCLSCLRSLSKQCFLVLGCKSATYALRDTKVGLFADDGEGDDDGDDDDGDS